MLRTTMTTVTPQFINYNYNQQFINYNYNHSMHQRVMTQKSTTIKKTLSKLPHIITIWLQDLYGYNHIEFSIILSETLCCCLE